MKAWARRALPRSMSLCTCIRAALFASVAAPLLWAIQAFAQEETAADLCNQLFDTFDSMNGPLDDVDDLRTRIRTMATILNSSSSNPDECWFSYKVRANYAHMLQLDGRMHLSIEQNRQAVRLALKYNPADILTPAFNLATSLQTWSFGDPLLTKEANHLEDSPTFMTVVCGSGLQLIFQTCCLLDPYPCCNHLA